MKDQYEEDLKKRIESLETNYGYLKQKVDELDRDDELERKLAAARKSLARLGERGEGAWEDVKDKAEEAWKDVEESFEKLKRRFKKD